MADSPEKLEPKAPEVREAPAVPVSPEGTATSRKSDTVLIDEEAAKSDEARQEAAKEAALKQIKDALIKTAADSLDARTETSGDIAAEILLLDVSKIDREWAKRRQDLYARAEKGERITYADLTNSTSEIEKQMQDSAGIITAYIFEMAGRSVDGKLSAEALAEMRNSVNRSSVAMANLAMKQNSAPELVEAVQFALKTKKIEKSKAFDTLSKTIFGKSDLSSYAWTALSFMSEDLQIEFGKFYIENNKLNPLASQGFLETWSVQGNISVETMRKILENSKVDTKEFEKKVQEYARNWKAKNDFVKSAVDMAKQSYGATNQATDMMTPTGILTFMGKLWSVGTIGINLATAAFYGGKINNLGFITKSLAENPWFITGAGTLAAIKAKEAVGSVGEALKSKDEKEAQSTKSAKRELKYLIAGNLEVEAFLKSKGTYDGSKKFFDYLQYVRREKGSEDMPFPEKEMTKKAFSNWMKTAVVEAKGSEQSVFANVITSLNKAKITDAEFYRLAAPFDKLGIGGMAAEKNYLKAIA